jgi:hypothetical protein
MPLRPGTLIGQHHDRGPTALGTHEEEQIRFRSHDVVAVAYHRLMIATAYLRVYLPAARAGALPPHRDLNVESSLRFNGEFVWTEPTQEDAIYSVWEGDQYVCPRNTRLRMLEGVVAFGGSGDGSFLVPEHERLAAVEQLSTMKRSSALARSFILSSAWHVPLRWFAAFRPSERDLYEENAVTSIRYRTSIGEAIDRVRWAATVLENAGFPEGPIENLNDLERWLADFSADAMVELDYARVATLFNEADLVFDESAFDVRESLLALEAADQAKSAEGYQRVARRWAHPQAYTFIN